MKQFLLAPQKLTKFALASVSAFLFLSGSASAQNLCCPTDRMDGLYVIDSRINPVKDCYTFSSLSDAADALMQRGVDGPVILSVAAGSGPYTNAAGSTIACNLSDIPGVSDENTITIYGNGTTVQTTNSPAYQAFKISNTAYISVIDFDIKSYYGVLLAGKVGNINVINNKFSNGWIGVYGEELENAGGEKGIYIAGNNIYLSPGGSSVTRGITLLAKTGEQIRGTAERNYINSNTNGIQFNNFVDPKVIGNEIILRANVRPVKSNGISIGGGVSERGFVVAGNKIKGFRTSGIYITHTDCSNGRNLLANNMVEGFKLTNPNDEWPMPWSNPDHCPEEPGVYNIYNQQHSTLGIKGIYLNYTENLDVFHNSVEIYSPAGFAFHIAHSSNYNNVANNSFSYLGENDEGLGYAMRLEQSAYNTITHNNFYSNGTVADNSYQMTACTNPCSFNHDYDFDYGNSSYGTSLISTAFNGTSEGTGCLTLLIVSYNSVPDFIDKNSTLYSMYNNTTDPNMEEYPDYNGDLLHINSSSPLASENYHPGLFVNNNTEPNEVLLDPYNVDVDGEIRNGLPDIGADELCDGQNFRTSGNTNLKDNFSVSPVPFSNAIRIKLNDGEMDGPVNVKMYDMLGKVVLNKQLDTKSLREIEVGIPANIPQGSYILEIKNGTHSSTQKVVKM